MNIEPDSLMRRAGANPAIDGKAFPPSFSCSVAPLQCSVLKCQRITVSSGPAYLESIQLASKT